MPKGFYSFTSSLKDGRHAMRRVASIACCLPRRLAAISVWFVTRDFFDLSRRKGQRESAKSHSCLSRQGIFRRNAQAGFRALAAEAASGFSERDSTSHDEFVSMDGRRDAFLSRSDDILNVARLIGIFSATSNLP